MSARFKNTITVPRYVLTYQALISVSVIKAINYVEIKNLAEVKCPSNHIILWCSCHGNKLLYAIINVAISLTPYIYVSFNCSPYQAAIYR